MENYCKVLIIDDEFIMRQGMKHMLEWEKEGFQIVGEATDGQEGLDLVAKMQPDIVLADIVMPVLDGIEFSRILQQRYPDVQLIILSSYDKFEYVKPTLLNGAVDYILKPTLNPEILLKTLTRAARNIPGMVLQKEQKASPGMQIERMLSGYQDKPDEALFAETFPYTLYRMLGINLKTACDSSKSCMIKVRETLEEFFTERKSYVAVSFLMEEEILCLVFNYRMKDEKNVLADIEACISIICNMAEKAFFIVGKSFSSMKQIKSCYEKEIRPYVDWQFYFPGKHLMVVQGDEEVRKGKRFAFEEYTNELMHRQYEKALERFRMYIDEIREDRMDEYRLKNLTKNLLYNFLIEVEQYQVESEKLKKQYFSKIEKASDVDSFGQVMQDIFGQLKRILEVKIGTEDERIRQIKRYINDNYAENLELSVLADRFGFSYHYLSSYFSRQTKEGFSEYLNKIRIEKAIDLLKESELPIAQISGEVGYADQSYFCRVFKRNTGETPSGYRRNHR